MRVYELSGLQLWTFTPGWRKRKWKVLGRARRKIGPFLNWNYGDLHGSKHLTRAEAASFLMTFRRDVEKTLEQ